MVYIEFKLLRDMQNLNNFVMELILTYFFLTSARYFRGVSEPRRSGNLSVGGDERVRNNRKDPVGLRKEYIYYIF